MKIASEHHWEGMLSPRAQRAQSVGDLKDPDDRKGTGSYRKAIGEWEVIREDSHGMDCPGMVR